MSRTPSPTLDLGPLDPDDPTEADGFLNDFIAVAERQRGSPAASEAVYVALPHETEGASEAEMDEVDLTGADTPTQDERDNPSRAGKAPPSPDAVETGDETGRRLVLAATSPTYTPPPLGGLHRGLRMVVADLSHTFTPPPDPACGDQWRGPDYVPSPVAELERLEARRAELQEELRNRRAGYAINWAQGPSPPGTDSLGPSPPAVTGMAAPGGYNNIRRPRPSAFSPPRRSEGPPPEAPPAYSLAAPVVAATQRRGGRADLLDDPSRSQAARPVTPARARPATTTTTRTPAPTTREDPGEGSYLEQFIPTERVPLDAEGAELANNTAKLINTLWARPMTRTETTEIYASLPRPANADGLRKTRMNPEIESTLPARVKDNDAALASAQWGIQFAARPLAGVLDAVERGEPLSTKDLVASLVTSMKILARTSNTILTMRRDNVRPTLQNQLKPLARKDGGQGFKYLLGEDLTSQVTSMEASRKTANTIIRVQGARPNNQRTFDRKSGNFRGGQGRSRQTQSAPRHRPEEGRTYSHRPSGGGQTRPQRGGRGRSQSSYRGRTGRYPQQQQHQ